jgi:exodeoxyribonuclease V alpha subunit
LFVREPGSKPTWLEARVDRVVWASASSGYAVVRMLDDGGAPVMAVGLLGPLAESEPGTFAALEGRWEDHPVHGRQFRSDGWLQGTPKTLDGLRVWLASAGVKGIGLALAGRIVEAFGEHTPAVLSDQPERLREVPGIGEMKAQSIREAWTSDQAGRALAVTLRGLGLSARLVERIRQRYGEHASQIVSLDPYRLAEEISGVGFRTADALARQQGLPPDDPGRVRAAVSHVLDGASDDGHCFLPRSDVRRRVAELDVPVGGIDDAIAAAEGVGRVVVEAQDLPADDRIWATSLYMAELGVARDLAARRGAGKPPDPKEIADAERWEGVALDPTQRAAVEAALTGGAVVVTGGPGTGKTTLVRVLLRVARERGLSFRLASPTGRAARRLEEAAGQPASTIHRLLEFNPANGGFLRTFANPIEGDGLVVDEASMVDLPLAQALLDALPQDPSFPLVWVGDVDQLPSVGPGQFLRDLIASGRIPVARLSTIHRQGKDSGIVWGAAEIHAGRVPTSGERAGRDDLFLLPRDDAEAARETLVQVVTERLPARGFSRDGIQVLAPTRRGALGTEALNELLQRRLNPDGAAITRGGKELRVGDRVICTRNRYDVEVFNGDIGEVARISGAGLAIRFESREVPWAFDELGMLDLAYAITVHKSQGSEYPAVVLALHGSHGLMLRRNLFYTALTRARRFACVIGTPAAWWRSVQQTGGDERNTALAQRISELGR